MTQALLFVFLYEYAEIRQHDFPYSKHGKLQHLTLIEEAHRLLQAMRGSSSPEVGDPKGKAVSMFTDMLAEMRAYGEGFIMADQIPTKLTPETMKNSNLKIVHRLTAPDDRQAAGGCINLTDQQIKHLNNLPPGLAVVHDERIGEAVLTRINHVKDLATDSDKKDHKNFVVPTTEDRRYLHRHSGCRYCQSPCEYYSGLKEIEAQGQKIHEPKSFWESILFEDIAAAWEEWSKWSRQMSKNSLVGPYPQGREMLGLTYCIIIQSAYEWIGEMLAARNQTINTEARLLPPNRLQREKAVHACGEMLSIWIRKTEIDEESQLIFTKTREQLNHFIFSKPSYESSGCSQCQIPCQLLPFVAPYVATLINKVTPVLLSQQPLQMRLSNLEHITASIRNNIPILNQDKRGSTLNQNWLYCLISHFELSPQTAILYSDLMDFLKQPPKEAGYKELNDIFGGVSK